MTHHVFTTSSCVGASRAIVSELFKVSSAQRGGKGTASCGILPPPYSNVFGVNSLPCASSSKLPVHRSPGGNRLMVRAFTTPFAVPMNTVFDPSIGSKYLPCSNRDSRGLDGGWMAAKASTKRSLNSRAFPRFVRMLSCHLDALHTNSACWLQALPHSKPTPLPFRSTLHVLRRRSLIFLQNWIADHLQQTFLAPHRQSKPISPPGKTREWKAQCHIETPLCGNPKCPHLRRSFSPPCRILGSPLLLQESNEQKLTRSLHHASPELDSLHAVPPPLQ